MPLYFVQFCFVFEIKNTTKKSRMPITRSKRTADLMISLGAVKKRRIAKDLVNEEVEETKERTKCTEIPQVAKFVENGWNAEKIEFAPDDDILKTSDLNQNISAEVEFIDDDNDLHFEETEVKKNIVPEKTSKKQEVLILDSF